MNFRPGAYDYNYNRINRNLFMDEKRLRMTEYNDMIIQKNLKNNRTGLNFSNNYREQRNFPNYYSSNNKENRDRIDIASSNYAY